VGQEAKKNTINEKPLDSSSVEPDREDHELMLSVQQGDRYSFNLLYHRYKKPIRSYLYYMTRKTEVADELAHEVFLKVYRNRESYQPTAKFSTWLWTIAKNLGVDHLRKKKEVLYRNKEDDSAIQEYEDVNLSNAEQQLIEQSEKQQVEDCFNNLNDKQKEALGLRIFSQLSYDEISRSMKITLVAVKSIIFRAKTALIECVQKRMKQNEQ